VTTGEWIALGGVTGGLLLNVAAISYGYGKLSAVVQSLDMRVGTTVKDFDRRVDKVLAALEGMTKELHGHAERLARVEERLRAHTFLAREDEE
jgi:hypothetical protein